jgi:MFS family permease
LGLTIAGLALLGVACATIFCPLLAEIIEAVQEKEGLEEHPQLNDKATGLFNGSYAIGCIIAPIYGGALADKWGFPTTCDVMALSSFVFGVLYFFINILPFFFIKKAAPLSSKPSVTRFEDGVVEERRSLKAKTTIQKGNDTLDKTTGEGENRLSEVPE